MKDFTVTKDYISTPEETPGILWIHGEGTAFEREYLYAAKHYKT